jgi:hypothetical protein
MHNPKAKENKMGGACSKKGGEKEHVYSIGRKAREKETTKQTKTEMGG